MTDPLFKPLEQADIRWDTDGVPYSRAFDDLYFSRYSGLDETDYVFIEQNQLIERWNSLRAADFSIGETGFGTGLNFLAAAHHWLSLTPKGSLHFVSAEKYPIDKAGLRSVHNHWPRFTELAGELSEQLPPPVAGIHRLKLARGRVILTLLYGDATEQFTAIKGSDHPYFRRCGNPAIDAWFLDGFAPAKNPQMWSDELFQTLADLSAPGATFSTFTAAGKVKRGLKNAGFLVTKVSGFGNKRDMLAGVLEAPPSIQPSETELQPSRFNATHQPPWYLASKRHNKPRSAVIIGGGIAGCTTARALAERGISVTLIERNATLASEGSGNLQGITYPRLSIRKSPLALFSLSAFLYACRFYRPYWQDPQREFGRRSGVILLPETAKECQTFNRLAAQFPPEMVRQLSGDQLPATAGIHLAASEGLFFPNAGWVHPSKICQSLCQHAAINVIQGDAFEIQHSGHWQVSGAHGQTIAEATSLVLACGTDSNRFAQTSHLPLKAIRGQISHLPASQESMALKTVICGAGYLAPAFEGIHTLGATYNLDNNSPHPNPADHQQNIEQMVRTDHALAAVIGRGTAANLDGRVAFRCTTPDYLPIAGPAPIESDFLEQYRLLRNNAKAHIPVCGSYWPDLYVNCGHGSRGMSYGPFCAELIAGQVARQTPPLELRLRQAINPARFLIRNLKRKAFNLATK